MAALSAKPQDRGDPNLLLPNARLARLLGASQLPLLADLFWIRMSALAGSVTTPPVGMALISWADAISQLDSKMFWPYAMGGLLGVVHVGGRAYNAPEAARLLKKGTAEVPDVRLFIFLAYLQLTQLEEPAEAAHTLQEGARLPGAPPFLAQLATRILASTGRFASAREFALQMLQDPNPDVRATFEYRLKEIEREQSLQQLQDAVADYTHRHQGSAPTSLHDLVDAGLVKDLPIDPLGGEFKIERNGTVSATSGERLRLRSPEQE